MSAGVTSAIVIRVIGAEEWQLLREIRLRALNESPKAFSKTATEEAAYDEAEWRRRVGSPTTSPPVRWLVAELGGQPVGLACGRVDPERPEVVNVFSMWVEPGQRRAGVGRRLLQAVIDWARAMGARKLVLGVAAASAAAIELYESIGFVRSEGPGPAGQSAPSAEGAFIVMALVISQAPGDRD